MDKCSRCKWVPLNNEKYVKYHDEIWGKEVFDDQELFMYLMLEIFSSGLSFETIVNKMDNFKLAFDNFDINKIINYDENKINELLNNKGIIRNKAKILATINNAMMFKKIVAKYNGFHNYLMSFTNNKIIYEYDKDHNELSNKITKDLKANGFKFIGTVTIYAYLQAIGIINSHDPSCFLYKIKR